VIAELQVKNLLPAGRNALIQRLDVNIELMNWPVEPVKQFRFCIISGQNISHTLTISGAESGSSPIDPKPSE